MINCSSFIDWVVNSLVAVWPLPADFPFVSEIVIGPLPVFQPICVDLHRVVCRVCVSHCVQVCSPSLAYHSWPLQKGLSLALPPQTVKFPLWTAWTMQTLPRLPATSASALEAIYRPQPQEYLCRRHPIISLWCCGEKGPMVSGPGNCVRVGLTQISSSSDKNSGKVRGDDNKSLCVVTHWSSFLVYFVAEYPQGHISNCVFVVISFSAPLM